MPETTVDLAALQKQLADLAEQNQKLAEMVQKTNQAVLPAGTKSAAEVLGGTPNDPARVPTIRIGEDVMTSRGISLLKMIGSMRFPKPIIPKAQCKVEWALSDEMRRVLCGKNGMGFHSDEDNALMPLGTSLLPAEFRDSPFAAQVKSMMYEGVATADPDEMKWIAQKTYGRMAGYQAPGQKAAQSWLTETLGGALVAPPEQGELITLLRNKEALVNAGARVVPLPPQGRLIYPRHTGAGTAYWVNENLPIATSTVGTGIIELVARKLAVLIQMPNELIRFASPAAEALLRDDMTKDLALGLDLAGLEGVGTGNQPLGIINHANINTITSSTTGAAGDSLNGKDVYRMIASVEESNAEFEGWIMRPKTLYGFYQLRADAVSAADQAGPFLFNILREAGDKAREYLGGYPVTKSTQVSRSRVKGSGTTLTYILGGMFSDVLIGMFGAIEFAATTMGDTSFQNDQTWVRGILSADIGVRHEAAFVIEDTLSVT